MVSTFYNNGKAVCKWHRHHNFRFEPFGITVFCISMYLITEKLGRDRKIQIMEKYEFRMKFKPFANNLKKIWSLIEFICSEKVRDAKKIILRCPQHAGMAHFRWRYVTRIAHVNKSIVWIKTCFITKLILIYNNLTHFDGKLKVFEKLRE